MQGAFKQIPQSIVEQAIAWHMQINSSHANTADKAEFENWLSQHASHAEAYQRIESIFKPFEDIDSMDVQAAKKSLNHVLKSERRAKGRKNLHGVALGLTLFTAVYLGLQMQTIKIMFADNATAIGEIKTVELPDHSYITMNTNTALDVQFDKHKRIIKLYKGEVFVEVSKDASRPFLVMTKDGDVRALGTQFNVKINQNSTYVGVVESKVEACNSPQFIDYKSLKLNQRQCVTLHQNQGADLTSLSVEKDPKVDGNAISSWITGMIAFDNQPLPEGVLNFV